MGKADARIPELDGLRGIAILLVLGWHFTGMLMDPSDGAVQEIIWRFGIFGQSGVDLFFVLSGFLIVGIVVDNRTSPTLFRTFYARRALRILPPYLLLVFSFAIASAIFGRTYYLGRDLPLWSLLTFSQNWVMSYIRDFGPAGISATWSLTIEEQFYLVAPAIIIFLPRRFLWPALIAVGLTSIAARSICFALYPENVYAPYVLTPLRLDGLSAGGLIAIAYRSPKWSTIESRKSLLLTAMIVLLAVAPFYTWFLHSEIAHQVLYHFGHSYLTVLYGLALLNILTRSGTVATSWLRSPAMIGVGAISYSLYLFHTPFKGIFFIAAGHPESFRSWTDGLLLFLALLSTFAFCAALYWIIERPAQKLGKSFSYATTKSPCHRARQKQERPFELSQQTVDSPHQ